MSHQNLEAILRELGCIQDVYDSEMDKYLAIYMNMLIVACKDERLNELIWEEEEWPND